jgi:excisionase family DNA binding protein
VTTLSEYPTLLTPQEAATLLRIRLQLLYALSRRGVLPSIRLGRLLRFNAAVLNQLMAQQSTEDIGHE